MNMQEAIAQTCDELKTFLLEKNKAYGDSASKPVRIFSKTDTLEQINVRIDDKLSRIARGNEYDGDDTELDLIGYLILKRAIKRSSEAEEEQGKPERLSGGEDPDRLRQTVMCPSPTGTGCAPAHLRHPTTISSRHLSKECTGTASVDDCTTCTKSGFPEVCFDCPVGEPEGTPV